MCLSPELMGMYLQAAWAFCPVRVDRLVELGGHRALAPASIYRPNGLSAAKVPDRTLRHVQQTSDVTAGTVSACQVS